MAVTKKPTTSKPAAKKTTAAKPVAKKTTTAAKKPTTAKPAAKKTTAAKPAAKKTTITAASAKTVASKSAGSTSGLSVRGNKKIQTFQKEFNKKFPYLGIVFYNRLGVELKGDRTFGEIAGAATGGEISISGNKKIGNLEKDFLKTFNIKVQVFYTTKSSGRVITNILDTWTLSHLNERCEKDGDVKGVWK